MSKALAAVVAWVLAASLSWLPVPVVGQPGPFSKSALNGETPDAYLARREAIARDAVAVAFDPAEAPVFDGPTARADTALLMMAIARFESGYDLLVDDGRVVGPMGESCVMQVMVDAAYKKGVGMITREGWTARELVLDRQKCMRAALHKLQVSRSICTDAKHPQNASHKALVGADAFGLYVGTRCVEGSVYAAHRYDLARKWAAGHPAPSTSASTAP